MSRDQVGKRSEVIDVTIVSWAAPVTSGSLIPIGIHCNAASTINGALSGDATESAWILPAGFTKLSFRAINTTSATKTGIRIIYGE